MRIYDERQINAFLWVSLIAVTALLLRKLFSLFELWAKARSIPGPPCPSFYGHCELISRSTLTGLLSNSHEIYGPVTKIWLGPTQLLVSVKDPELIREILLKASDKLPLTGRAFRLAFGRSSLFVSSFDEVEKRRNLLSAEINGKCLNRATLDSEEIMDRVIEMVQPMAKEGLDCEMVSRHLAFTLMGATLFGDVFLSWSKAKMYNELLMNIAKDACFWASYSITPIWNQEFRRYQQLCTKLKSLTQELIQLSKQQSNICCLANQLPHGEFKSKSSNPAFGASHLPTSHPDATDEPCGDLISIMFHASLTTAGLIGSILARLVAHPEIQEKIYSEIIMSRKVVKRHVQEDVISMPLLLATIYESARLLPAGPLLQRCSLKHDLSLSNGVRVPAGAILIVPVQMVQTDKSIWGSDASLFNPYRFLLRIKQRSEFFDEASLAGDLVNVGESPFFLRDPHQNATFLPFGSGARACIGEKLAIREISTILASLLERYQVSLNPESEGNTHPQPMMKNCVLQLLPSPKIMFVERSS